MFTSPIHPSIDRRKAEARRSGAAATSEPAVALLARDPLPRNFRWSYLSPIFEHVAATIQQASRQGHLACLLKLQPHHAAISGEDHDEGIRCPSRVPRAS
jgi:hypothetical protein